MCSRSAATLRESETRVNKLFCTSSRVVLLEHTPLPKWIILLSLSLSHLSRNHIYLLDTDRNNKCSLRNITNSLCSLYLSLAIYINSRVSESSDNTAYLDLLLLRSPRVRARVSAVRPAFVYRDSVEFGLAIPCMLRTSAYISYLLLSHFLLHLANFYLYI